MEADKNKLLHYVKKPVYYRKRLARLKTVLYNPDIHCGVMKPDQELCLRSTACSRHRMSLKLEVKGRSKDLTTLILEYRAAKALKRKIKCKADAPVDYAKDILIDIEHYKVENVPVVTEMLSEDVIRCNTCNEKVSVDHLTPKPKPLATKWGSALNMLPGYILTCRFVNVSNKNPFPSSDKVVVPNAQVKLQYILPAASLIQQPQEKEVPSSVLLVPQEDAIFPQLQNVVPDANHSSATPVSDDNQIHLYGADNLQECIITSQFPTDDFDSDQSISDEVFLPSVHMDVIVAELRDQGLTLPENNSKAAEPINSQDAPLQNTENLNLSRHLISEYEHLVILSALSFLEEPPMPAPKGESLNPEFNALCNQMDVMFDANPLSEFPDLFEDLL